MSVQLSKLHVRFIQSQKNFSLLRGEEKKQEKLPLSQLYVKDNSNFYLIIQNQSLQESENITICFDEATHALNTLECTVTKKEIIQGSEEYEDALLFFNTDISKIKQVFALHIDALDEK